MAKPHISKARTMTPSKAAAFLREHFSKEEQLAELQAMLSAGGRTTNLAHGIAVELRLIEHEELEVPLVSSLKVKATDVSVGYGDAARSDTLERSPFAGKGPMFAQMGSSSAAPEDDDDESGGASKPADPKGSDGAESDE